MRLKFLFKYLRPYRKEIFGLVVISCLVAFLGVLFPLVMAPILDIATGKVSNLGQKVTLQEIDLNNLGLVVFNWLGLGNYNNKLGTIFILCGIYAFIALVKNGLDFLAYLIALKVRVSAGRDIESDLFTHILNFSLDFFQKEHTGALVSRLEKDTQAATSGLEEIARTSITALPLILFYGVLLFKTSHKLVWAALGAALLHYLISHGIKKPIRRHLADQFSALAEITTRLQESILSIRIVKSFSAENFELKQLKQKIEEAVKVIRRFGVWKHIEEPCRNTLNYFIEAAILVIAAAELLSGKLDAATFILFLYVGRMMMKPISDLGTSLTALQQALAASSRIYDLFNQQATIQDGPKRIDGFDNSLEIKNLSFAYDNKNLVLKDISLQIHKGEMLALVGQSGAGKSTLVDLILRFYDPQKGDITIDGEELASLKIENYRKLFGVVPQEALLFNATIKENIAYGREDINEEDIIRAAETANAHAFIMAFPDGYKTLVGDRGIRLSGGERQRIAIARAIVAHPEIVILDEATSSLDSNSERLVQEAIDKVIQNTTAIVIAHRLSTVLRADRIALLNKGKIEDIGKHSELLQRNPLYRQLYQLQFGDIKENSFSAIEK